MIIPEQTVLLRKLASYGEQVVILGSREANQQEQFFIVLDGNPTGDVCENWSDAIVKFRQAVLERQKAGNS